MPHGVPPLPYGAPPRATAADVAAERRIRPWGQLAVVALAVFFAVSTLSVASALRDLLEPLIDVIGETNPSEAEVEAAVDEVTARQEEYWWLNITGLLPLAALAGMAVWSNKVAGIGRALGYPARHSPGWAVGGWFVPVVNLWFPYQSIVDSVSPTNPRRGAVLLWWLVYVVGSIVLIVCTAVIVLDDADVGPWVAPVAACTVVQAVLGLRVVALVHDDHERAVSATT